MAAVVVAGASIAGLASALALAGRGHRVTVLEPAPPPPAEPDLARPAVPQSRHSHTLTSLGVSVLRQRAPHVLAALRDAGAVLLDLRRVMPSVPDDDLLALGCRRSTLEHVLYGVVRGTAGVEIRHGVPVRGLVLNGRRVSGVLSPGGRLPADVVVDATGRRAASRGWLSAAGVPLAPDLTSPSGLRGFTRFYRRAAGTAPGPLNRGNAAGLVGDHYACVVHPGDGDTFSVALGVLPEDRATRSLCRPGPFTAAARTTPGVADWLASGPATLTPIRAMTFPPNVVRTAAVGPQPIAGLFPIGDAACITNPLYGRGMSLAFAHAFLLADVLGVEPDPGPACQAVARDVYLPWFRQATRDDRDRIAVWRAALAGSPVPPPDRDGLAVRAVARAATDPVVWRGVTRMLMSLAPPEDAFSCPEFRRRVAASPAAPRPGPTRAALLAAVGDGG